MHRVCWNGDMNEESKMRDRTYMGISMVDLAKGTSKTWTEDILYKDYAQYEDLPDPCKSSEIEQEFRSYKEWEKSLGIANRLMSQLNRIHKR